MSYYWLSNDYTPNLNILEIEALVATDIYTNTRLICDRLYALDYQTVFNNVRIAVDAALNCDEYVKLSVVCSHKLGAAFHLTMDRHPHIPYEWRAIISSNEKDHNPIYYPLPQTNCNGLIDALKYTLQQTGLKLEHISETHYVKNLNPHKVPIWNEGQTNSIWHLSESSFHYENAIPLSSKNLSALDALEELLESAKVAREKLPGFARAVLNHPELWVVLKYKYRHFEIEEVKVEVLDIEDLEEQARARIQEFISSGA